MFRAFYKPDPIDRRVLYGHTKDGELSQKELKKRKFTQPDSHGQLCLPADKSLTAFQAREVIDALQRAKDSNKPFNITCSFNFPHSPILPTKPYYGMYKVEDMPIPASISDDMKDSPYIRENGRLGMKEYANPKLIGYMMSNYFGLVSEVDFWIGKILDKLREIGQEDNTLIVFISDHGEMLGAHGMREKNVFYEESARIPMILNFPKRIDPIKINQCVSLLDLFPTILDYLDIKYDKRDGESLVDVIKNKKVKEDKVVTEWLYNEGKTMSHMIVLKEWKFMCSYNDKCKLQPALYNLKEDPNEMVNLIGKSNPKRNENIKKANELKDELVKYLESKASLYSEKISEIEIR